MKNRICQHKKTSIFIPLEPFFLATTTTSVRSLRAIFLNLLLIVCFILHL